MRNILAVSLAFGAGVCVSGVLAGQTVLNAVVAGGIAAEIWILAMMLASIKNRKGGK